MSIILRDDFRKPLIEKLSDVLSKAKIQNNFFLNHDAFYELADFDEKFNNKPVGKTYQDYISESPLVDFLFEVLAGEIQSTRKYDSNIAPFSLIEIDEYKDPSSLAERLVKEFESLPQEYKLYIKLPIYGLKEVLKADRIELSSSLNLVTPNEELQAIFTPPIYEPRRRPIFSLFEKRTEQKLEWEDFYVYCEISAQGFIGIYEDTAPVKRGNFLVRAFCGLSLALQLFETGYAFYSTEDTYLKVYEKAGDKWNIKKPRLLPTELVQGLEKLKLHESYDPHGVIVKKRSTPILDTLKRLFSTEHKNERLLRAAQWYFDSYCGDNELLSFVKSTICLEILLGDKKVSDLIGITETLRNRCAYLIGSNHNEREEILKDVNDIYNTRSQIVHSGKNRLTKFERESLYKLRWLCRRVIKKEIFLDIADSV